MDETGGRLIVAEDPAFGTMIFAKTIPKLLEELALDLVMAWRGLALSEDCDLAPEAICAKQNLLAAMEEIPPGAGDDGSHGKGAQSPSIPLATIQKTC